MALAKTETMNVVAKALHRSRLKKKMEAEPTTFVPKERGSLLLVARVEPPPTIPYNPDEPTGSVGKDVELLECQGCEASTSTLQGMLDYCMNFKAVADLRRVHNHIVSTERCTRMLGNMLVKAYGVCGLPEESVSVFMGMRKRNVDGWTATIQAMTENGRHLEAFRIFRHMIQDGKEPNPSTYVQVLKSCVSIQEAKLVHSCASNSIWHKDISILNQLIETYGNVGAINEAIKIFKKANRATKLTTWKSVIGVNAKAERSQAVLKLFFKLDLTRRKTIDESILHDAVGACESLEDTRAVHAHLAFHGMDTNKRIADLLFRKYIKLRSLDDARMVFDSLQNELQWWEIMVGAYAREGDAKNVESLLKWMDLNGIKCIHSSRSQIIDTLHEAASDSSDEDVQFAQL